STHLGHAATYHAADLMLRALHDVGYEVDTAQNITDVEDPLLERAERDGVDWRGRADAQGGLFPPDLDALRIPAPAAYRSLSAARAPAWTGASSPTPRSSSSPRTWSPCGPSPRRPTAP